MKDILKKLISKEDLSQIEIQETVRKIAKNEASEVQIASFLTAITSKGVNKEEFFAFASTMREFAHRIETDKYIVDSCGTGADFSQTINISTASAILASNCGVNVIKQTNSSITSECGSTDLLHALNLDITKTPQQALENFNKNGIAFVHSPYFNDFAKINNPIRQQIGFKTIFNYLGPLINPCFPDAQLLGVSSLEMCEKIAYALLKLGTDRALVVNGINPNIDEISICSKTKVFELKNGKIEEYFLTPDDFGIKEVDISELKGGNAGINAKIIREIFSGEIFEANFAKSKIIALNAGAMIYLAGIKPSIYDGFKFAEEILLSGDVSQKLEGICV